MIRIRALPSSSAMNLHHVPELSWRHGYGWAVGLMVGCAGGLWVYFKRKGWL